MKKVKAQHWKTGAIFECIDCGKEFQLQATARQEAYNHAKKTGHKERFCYIIVKWQLLNLKGNLPDTLEQDGIGHLS